MLMPVGGHMCDILGVRHLGAGFTGSALQAVRWHKEVPASYPKDQDTWRVPMYPPMRNSPSTLLLGSAHEPK